MITKIYICTILNMCFTIFLNSAVQRFQYAKINRDFDGMVEFLSPLSIIMTSSSIECSMFCTLNDKCLTFFYNADTKQCVRHSKDFNFQVPSGKENGWSYYNTRDVSGRCPHSFLYYRHLDFCYTFDDISIMNFQQIRNKCYLKNSTLDSQQRHEYFKYILFNRTVVRVPVGGLRTGSNEWVLEDGASLTYFDWYPSEPTRDTHLCLELMTDDKLFDCSCTLSKPGVFICER